MELLKTLIVSSEKAANIARLLRENESLFEKLVEQKSSAEANPRFQEDFKTLADVLIQEMVKYDVGLKFPAIREKVHGEESNHFFSSELNREIIVEVKDTEEKTALLLSELLDDDSETANILASEVHRLVNIENVNTKIPEGDFIIDLDHLSVWIDPIDGTNEYVKGDYEEKNGDFYTKGLKCVTVLIGVYNDQGQPVMGVVNQPFFEKGVDEGYQCHWGLCTEQNACNGSLVKMSSVDALDWKETKIICVGGSESNAVIETLKDGGYELIVTRGAGYKLLTVVLGIVDAYILSKPTTFFWDTCAPQAILRALGGNIIEMNGMKAKQKHYITYESREDNSRCNINGIVAYRNEEVLNKIFKVNWTS